jgi:hypothetical protein
MKAFQGTVDSCVISDHSDGEAGYTWANGLGDYEGGLQMIGGSEEGRTPFDKFSKVNPKSMGWTGG